MTENIRTTGHAWMILNQIAKFQRFFGGYLDILKSNFKQISVMGQVAGKDAATIPAGRNMIVETQHGNRFST